jgi:hypothetical protein
MDIMNRKKARYTLSARGSRYQPRHPIVAMDKIRLNAGNYIIDNLTLKRKRQLKIVLTLRINRVAVIKATILRKMNALVGEVTLILSKFFSYELRCLNMEHSAIMRKCHMDISSEGMKGLN